MDIGQLDGISDRLDLITETTDLLVADVGHLFEDQLLHLRADQLLVGEAGPRLDPNVVAGPELLVEEGLGSLDDPFLVGVGHYQDSTVGQLLLHRHHLALSVEAAHIDDVHGVVEQDLLAALQLLDVDRRLGVDPQFAAAAHQVDGAVGVDAEHGAERVGRSGQLLDFLAQNGELLTCLFENGGELLVLGGSLSQLTFGLGDPLLQDPHPAGGVLQPATENGDLVFERLGGAAQRRQLPFVLLSLLIFEHLISVGAASIRSPPNCLFTHRSTQKPT